MTQVLDRIRNGVDSEQMYGTLDAIKADPVARRLPVPRHRTTGSTARTTARRSRPSTAPARRTRRARRRSRSTPASRRSCSARDTGPNPAEALLHALAACLTTTLVYVATARKVRLTAVESTLEGDMDVRGCLGLSDEVRNGFNNIRVSFKVQGDAPAEKLREIVERAQARSAVFDMVTNGVPVEVGVIAD